MGFFGKLFGGSDGTSKKKSAPQTPQRGGVPYNEGLIPQLINDHKKLVDEFTKISKAAQSKKYKTLKQYLKAFKVNLEIHNYSEKIQLYTYLKNYYDDNEIVGFIEDMAKSAEDIYKDVFAFLKKYEAIEFNDQYLGLFKTELNAIGQVLQARIEVEESELYPLYKI